MRRINKSSKGQFYLLSAIIIVGILIGFISVVNYLSVKDNSRVNEIAAELEIEGEKVLDYDKYNSQSEFANFAQNYSNYVGEEYTIYYIVGEMGDMDVYYFDSSGAQTGYSYEEVGSDLSVTIDDVDYDFDLKKGINFHFIIIDSRGNERHVAKG